MVAVSINNPHGDDAVFKSKERRAQFWVELQALMAKFPEMNRQPEAVFDPLEDQNDDGELHDENSPVIIDGIALIYTTRNLQGFEVLTVADPISQSEYMTRGIISAAHGLG